MSLRSYAIACHLGLKEISKGKAITELKEEFSKIREAHFEEVQSLEAKDECLAKDKGWG